MKIGINGFGRIGRLALRILWQMKDIEITHINETGVDSLAASHLQEFDNEFKRASETYLKGILGYEERPLASADYLNDSRSCLIDGLSTMVVNSNLLKVYAWYVNEWGV